MSRASSWRTGVDAGYVLLVVAVACAALYAALYAASGSGPRAGADGTVVASPSASRSPVTSLWFGDSVTAGCCRTGPAVPSFAEVAAKQLGWAAPQVVGEAGTGFVTARNDDDGGGAGAYPERIQAAVEDSYYDVVVVAGGHEDAGGDLDAGAFRAAVRAVLSQVRTSLPDAQLVVLGAYSPDGKGLERLTSIQREEAERADAAFVDPVSQGGLRGRPDLLDDDGFHPDDGGHAVLGARTAQALREVLPPRLVPDSAAGNA